MNSRTISNKSLGVGVIGVGNRGTIALHANQPQKNVNIVAIADINESYISIFEKELDRNLYKSENYLDIVNHKDVDAVMIFSPDYLHEEHALAALRANKDVFIEKPLSITVESCDRIIETAFKHKRKLFVGHNLRQMNFIKMMKDIIDSGIIGEAKTIWVRHFVSRGSECYFNNWHADKTKSNSLLVHKAVHDIDVIHMLAGSFTKAVNGIGSLSVFDKYKDGTLSSAQKEFNSVIDVEDSNTINMLLENGIIASYQDCYFTPDYWRNYTIIGTHGRIENFGSRTADSEIRVYTKKNYYNPNGDIVYKVPEEITDTDSPDKKIINAFIDYLHAENTNLENAVIAREAVATADFATRSIRNGFIPYEITKLRKELYF